MAGISEELRQAVLQAAIQGKLTQQLPEDGNAETLLSQIKEEKEKLIKEKKIKREKAFAPINEAEIPFEIPDNWKWVRFGNLGNYKKGPFGSALTKSMFVPKGSNSIKVYEQKNAIQKDASLGSYYITREYFESKMMGFEVFPGDVIVSCAGTIGESYILPAKIEQGIINQALMRMRIFEPMYLPYFLMYFDFVLKKDARNSSKGSAIKNIPPFEILKNYLIPIPPLSEQHRIVARVEELMSKIDELEKIEKELTALRTAFPGDMKAALIQAAMQGKLTEQLPEDGNADDLLAKIKEEKEALVKEKKIKKQKTLEPIIENEMPFEIPANWKWVKLGDIGYFVRGNGIKRTEITTNGKPCIRYGQLYTTFKIKFKEVVSFIPEELYDKCQKVHTGDILMALTGENNFDIALATAYLGNDEIAMGGDMTKLVSSMDPMYLVWVINSEHSISYKRNMAKGNIIVHISNEKLANIPIPVPPLAEQQRIVEKLDKLLPLCESLETNL